MPTTVHLLNTVEKQPRPLTQMIHPLSSPQLWNGSEEEMTSAEESSEDEPEVVGLKYAPPTPLPETSTPTNSNAYKYFTLENKMMRQIWLEYPGKATSK